MGKCYSIPSSRPKHGNKCVIVTYLQGSHQVTYNSIGSQVFFKFYCKRSVCIAVIKAYMLLIYHILDKYLFDIKLIPISRLYRIRLQIFLKLILMESPFTSLV